MTTTKLGMKTRGSVEQNVKELLRRNFLQGPVELMSEVLVLCNSLNQKFPDELETTAVLERLLPIREAAEVLDADRTMALTKEWIEG